MHELRTSETRLHWNNHFCSERMKRTSSESETDKPSTSVASVKSDEVHTAKMAHEKSQKRVGKRPGRKPSKIDVRAKLERSRQSARECRARKKLRYQYLEELVSRREKTVFSLREELERYRRWCQNVDDGFVPDDLREKIMMSDNGSIPKSSPPAARIKEET